MTSAADMKTLKWEWPDKRKPDSFLVVALTGVSKEGGGLFGIRRSPSLADTLPDARILEGRIATRPPGGDLVRLRAPGAEIPELHTADRVAFGLVGDRVCICVLRVPPELTDSELPKWLAEQPCGG